MKKPTVQRRRAPKREPAFARLSASIAVATRKSLDATVLRTGRSVSEIVDAAILSYLIDFD